MPISRRLLFPITSVSAGIVFTLQPPAQHQPGATQVLLKIAELGTSVASTKFYPPILINI